MTDLPFMISMLTIKSTMKQMAGTTLTALTITEAGTVAQKGKPMTRLF